LWRLHLEEVKPMPAPNARLRPTGPSSAPATRQPAAGETHELTNYRLAERTGQEELATVYRATHLTLDRPVQIAILRRTDWISTSRFQLAARLAARLSHPNILPVVDAGHDPRYGDYIVTPQLDAQPLEQMLTAGPLDPLLALRIFAQVAGALDYLHEQNIYHRDVRPANILVTPQHTAYLTNFSLASAPDTPDLSTIEEADYLTPYSAPEQNLTASDRSPALDLYSLGAVLYHMLSGELPPGAGQQPRSLAERNAALAPADRVIRRLLIDEPRQRFGSGAQATTALRQALRKQIDESTDDMEESRWEPMAEWLENPLETVLGDRLSHDFVARSRTRADMMHRSGAIKRYLDRWSRQGFLRRPALGQLIDPEQIVSYNIYFYELKAHYETRTPLQTREQIHTGGTITPGRMPELWEVPVPDLEPFEDAASEQIVLPGSQQTVPCGECNGATQVVCKTCGGKGAIERSRKVKEANGTVRNETLQENCPTCRGYGRTACTRCEGAGQMLREQFFTWSRHGRLYMNEDDIGGLHKLTLETQLEQVYQTRINPHDPSLHQVAPIHEMLEQAINGGGADSRLIAAELTIRGVPVTEVDYPYRNKSHSLALIGFKDVVRGDLTMVDLERLGLYIAVAVLLLAVVMVLVIR
jgi:serine/threonine protein kinase